jgi:hypothetical protein
MVTYEETQPDSLVAAMTEQLSRDIDYADVETDGAARAAAMIAELL